MSYELTPFITNETSLVGYGLPVYLDNYGRLLAIDFNVDGCDIVYVLDMSEVTINI